MRITYDTKFIDDGKTLDLISIGMVAEDGRKLYAVSHEFNQNKLTENEWLVKNVWKHLPTVPTPAGIRNVYKYGKLDRHDPVIRPRGQIARMVHDFIKASGPDVSLWAWYAAYDHVALAQLFGPMINMPQDIPWQTDDIRTEWKRLGKPEMPEQNPSDEHHALFDARHAMEMLKFLDRISERDTVEPDLDPGPCSCGDPSDPMVNHNWDGNSCYLVNLTVDERKTES